MPRVKKSKPPIGLTFLRQWRKYRSFTQEQAAEPLQIDATTLGRIERGETPYGQHLLEAAARLYECTPQDLIGRDPFSSEDIWSAWLKFDDKQKVQALNLLKALDTSNADPPLQDKAAEPKKRSKPKAA